MWPKTQNFLLGYRIVSSANSPNIHVGARRRRVRIFAPASPNLTRESCKMLTPPQPLRFKGRIAYFKRRVDNCWTDALVMCLVSGLVSGENWQHRILCRLDNPALTRRHVLMLVCFWQSLWSGRSLVDRIFSSWRRARA
jgi:hypothetical protein